MNTLAANPPHYLPGIDFFYKMSRVQQFVIADDLSYRDKGRVNRARIKNASGMQWLTVPVRHRGAGSQWIRDVRIDGARRWGQKHRKTLEVNYRYSPYFEFYIDAFAEIYEREWRYLLDLDLALIGLIRKALGITVPLQRSSALDLAEGATEKIIDLAGKIGAGRYLAAPEDAAFLDQSRFQKAGVALAFSDYQPRPYRQQFGDFVPGLSVVDLLFNEGPEAKWILLESSGEGQA